MVNNFSKSLLIFSIVGFFVVAVLFVGGFFNSPVSAKEEPEPECECEPGSFDHSGDCSSCNYRINYYNNCDCSTYEQKDYDESCRDELCPPPENPNPRDKATNTPTPGTLSWDEVEIPDHTTYYHYEIIDAKGGTHSDTIEETEKTFNYCLFEPETSYEWGVKSCVDSSGSDCGNPSEWTFTTNSAPQPLSPRNKIDGVSLPTIHFDWCDVPKAKSYYLLPFRNGEPCCHSMINCPIVVNADKTPESKIDVNDLDIFTKNNTYEWSVAACFGENFTQCGKDCGSDQYIGECADFNQKWKFSTGENVTLEAPTPIAPTSTDIVNFSDALYWGHATGSLSYRVKFDGEKELPIPRYSQPYFSTFWTGYLNLNSTHTWQVAPCWDEKGTDCEDIWSQEWDFKTTGATPTGLSPTGETETIIPVRLNWDDMPGALSYRYEIATDETFSTIVVSDSVKKSEAEVGYPDIKMGTDYYWRVSTCADENGEVCGNPTTPLKFTTLKLPSPSNPSPKDGESAYFSRSFPISWENISWAKSYQYHLEYFKVAEKEETDKEKCSKLLTEKPVIVQKKTVSTNSDSLSLQCLGDYRWSVRACLSDDCSDRGEDEGWSELWTFTLTQYVPRTEEKGFIPCGKNYDNLETPYNEREPCGIQHIFLMLQIILNFVLWRLGIIILAVLSIIVGVISYFSLGSADTSQQIKSLLKAAAVGWLIVLLAWMFINYLLSIFGFNISIFGRWWILP